MLQMLRDLTVKRKKISIIGRELPMYNMSGSQKKSDSVPAPLVPLSFERCEEVRFKQRFS